MYNLEDANGSPLAWNEQVKEQFIKGLVKSHLRFTDGTTINQDNYLKNASIDESRFVPKQGIIGQATAKQVNIKIYNENNTLDLQDKEFEYLESVNVENIDYYINYGNFIVQHPENENLNDNTEFEALDYMCKFNQPYIDRVQYPCTLGDLAEDVCLQAGVVLANKTFTNANFVIEDNQFVGGESLREIIKAIASAAFSWARIRQDNKLYFDFNNSNNETLETFDQDNFINLTFDSKLFGPVNRIIMRNSKIEGENVTIDDPNNPVTEENLCEIVISDNPFAYSQLKRQQLIEGGRKLFGFSYKPVSIPTIGYAWLESGDLIDLIDLQENNFSSIVLNHIQDYNGTLSDTIESPAMTKTETKYTFQSEMLQAQKRTEIMVDKANQRITSVVSEIGDRSQKTTTITQDLDKIESEISDIGGITKTEAGNGTIEMDNINTSEPIYILVHPDRNDIKALHPSQGLHPKVGLYPHSRELYFINTTDNTTRKHNIPKDLLWLSNTVYDEYVVDYTNQLCYIIHKVGIDENGNKYALETQTTEYFTPYPFIPLTEGDYTITLKSNLDAYIKATLMSNNIYTNQFATKYELTSSIRQTKNEIALDVTHKLSNYSTTTEMQSAINLSATQITSTVSETYATKTSLSNLSSTVTQQANSITTLINEVYPNGTSNTSSIEQNANDITLKVSKNGVIASINATSETVKIQASKLNLQGYVTLSNLSTAGQTEINGANIKTGTLSANKITSGTLDATKVTVTNLSASNINTGSLTLSNFTGTYAINSAGFKVTKTGAITSTSGKIGGYTISNYNLYSTQVGISSENNHGWAFWAGDDLSGEQPSEYGKNAPFRVGHNGYVYASNIDIAGGSFNVNNNFLVSDNGYLTIKDQGYSPNYEPNLLIRRNNDTRIRTSIYSNYLILTRNSNNNTDMIEMTGGYGLDIYCSTYQGEGTGYFFSANNTSGTYSSSEIYAVNGYCMHGRDGHTYSCGWDDDRERLNFYVDNILVKTL